MKTEINSRYLEEKYSNQKKILEENQNKQITKIEKNNIFLEKQV